MLPRAWQKPAVVGERPCFSHILHMVGHIFGCLNPWPATRNRWSCFRVSGLGHSETAFIFSDSALTCPWSKMTDWTWKSHFSAFTNSLFSKNLRSTWQTWETCFDREEEKIRMSLNTKRFRKSYRMSFTEARNTASALVNPKGMTKYSKWSSGLLNAIFHSSPSQMCTRWLALQKSSLKNTVALFKGKGS